MQLFGFLNTFSFFSLFSFPSTWSLSLSGLNENSFNSSSCSSSFSYHIPNLVYVPQSRPIRTNEKGGDQNTVTSPDLADSGSGHISGTGRARILLSRFWFWNSSSFSGVSFDPRVRGRLRSRWEIVRLTFAVGGNSWFSSVTIIVGVVGFILRLSVLEWWRFGIGFFDVWEGRLDLRISIAVRVESEGGAGSGLLMFADILGHYL